MYKRIIIFVLMFMSSLSFLSGEWLGNETVLAGKPSPFNKGLLMEYGESGYMQVVIHNHRFVVIFLDSQKNVKVADKIDLVTVFAQSTQGNSPFYPYHLQPVAGGLYFWNSRYVYEPHRYNVEVHLRKEIKKSPPYRGRKAKTRYVKETFDVRLLDQRQR